MFSNEKIENTYIIKDNLGSGSYGSVFIVEKRDNLKTYAMKRINTSQLKNVNDYRRQVHEMNILFFNKCPYLLHATDVSYIREKYRLDIITDLYTGKNLNNFINKYKVLSRPIPNDIIWSIFIQLCLGVQYLHINDVIHRDLKPANILLDNKDRPKQVVICDFGASICLDGENEHCYTKIGTPYFMSPEQNNANFYDKKTDIWSLGCILYELLTLEKPFEADNINMLNHKINKGKYKSINIKSTNIDNHFWSSLIKQMLEHDVKNRISINSILELDKIKENMNNYNLIPNTIIQLDIPMRLNAKYIQSSYALHNYILNLKEEYSKIIKPKTTNKNENIITEKNENIITEKKK